MSVSAFVLRSGLLASAAAAFSGAAAAQTQPQPAPTPPAGLVSPMPVPGQLELAKLIWSTLAAVDHANLAGNYSVLRDLAAPSFQTANDSARLAQIFAGIRSSGLDLSGAMLLAPTYTTPPVMIAPNVLRAQGIFGLRPTGITFDLQYEWVAGRWRLFGISVSSISLPTNQPGVTPVQPPPPRPTNGR